RQHTAFHGASINDDVTGVALLPLSSDGAFRDRFGSVLLAARNGNVRPGSSLLFCWTGGSEQSEAKKSLFTVWARSTGSSAGGAAKDRGPLKKAHTPRGRLDHPDEEEHREVVQRFPDDVNPETKEKGGPRGPEPTRYGDWERKGRCIDF
uniref:Succinate dehydrogenase assembly factor 4, mitochondrial n=1 Tax=Scleropages formosus TaxID=113540 RepID=A0A8C9U6P3_SCLFO